MNKKIITAPTLKAAVQEACTYILRVIDEEIHNKGACTLVLSGGKTPEPLYRMLADRPFRDSIPWDQIFVFWGDERFVPHTHPESNYRMVFQTLLKKVPIPEKNIFPIETDTTPEQAAALYEKKIRVFFEKNGTVQPGPENLPVFDLILLGMGMDGHTASLYEKKQLQRGRRWVTAVDAPGNYNITKRVSLTLPLINSATRVAFLVSGEEKRDTLEMVLGNQTPARFLPARKIHARSETVWFTDILVLPEK